MDNIGERHTVILYSVCMFGQHFQQSVGQPGIVASPARGQLNRKNEFPCPCSRLRIWSPETQVRPSRPASPRSFSTLRLNHQSSIINHQSSIINHQSSIINHQSSIINHQPSIINLVLNRGISPAFRDDGVHIYIRSTAKWSVQSLSGHVCTDGVQCRQSASKGPVVLKAVLVTGAAFPGFTMSQF